MKVTTSIILNDFTLARGEMNIFTRSYTARQTQKGAMIAHRAPRHSMESMKLWRFIDRRYPLYVYACRGYGYIQPICCRDRHRHGPQ